MPRAVMPLPAQRALALPELRAVIQARVPTRIAAWQVYAAGDCAPWPDRLTAVPYLMLSLAGAPRVLQADGGSRPIRVGEAACFLAGSHATVVNDDDSQVLRVTLDRPHLYWALGRVRRTADPDFRRWDHQVQGIALPRDRHHLFDELLAHALHPPAAAPATWRPELVAAAWQLLRAWVFDHREVHAGRDAATTWRLACEYLREHLARATQRSDVAAALGLSANYLSDLCRHQTGVSYAHFVRDLRLERAALLLRTTTLPVRRIAEAVGWSSDGYLERRFRERYATTPARWRRAQGT